MLPVLPRSVVLAAAGTIFYCLAAAKEANGQNLLTWISLGEGEADLCSPRKLAMYQGTLYVAEAGIGIKTVPSDPNGATANGTRVECIDDGTFGVVCLGPTSRVSSYDLTTGGTTTPVPRTTVVDGLFSQRPVVGNFEPHATGAHSICFDSDGSGTWYLLVGLGLNGTELTTDDVETTIGAFGSVLRFDNGVTAVSATTTATATVAAAPWVDEYANNFDGVLDPAGVLPVPNSNPYHIACVGNYYYVADAGCNCIMKFNGLRTSNESDAELASVVVLPQYTQLPAMACPDVTPPFGPPFCGQYELDVNGTSTWFYDAEAVPTSVKMRPGVTDRVYVSTLVGALWTAPVAQVVEITIDANGDFVEDTIVEVAGGFHAVADFDFHGTDYLLVLETNPGSPMVPFSGRLTGVDLVTGETEIWAQDELTAPTGILVDGDTVYITNDTYSAGDDQCMGHVIKAYFTAGEDKTGFPSVNPVDNPTSAPSMAGPTLGGVAQLVLSVLACIVTFTQI